MLAIVFLSLLLFLETTSVFISGCTSSELSYFTMFVVQEYFVAPCECQRATLAHKIRDYMDQLLQNIQYQVHFHFPSNQ